MTSPVPARPSPGAADAWAALAVTWADVDAALAYPRPLLVSGPFERDGAADGRVWRCLACLEAGRAPREALELVEQVHRSGCTGSAAVAAARADLLETLVGVSEAAYGVSWQDGVERKLLRRGGMWAVLADTVGWPVGYHGVDGWDAGLGSALARYGWTVADLESPDPRR